MSNEPKFRTDPMPYPSYIHLTHDGVWAVLAVDLGEGHGRVEVPLEPRQLRTLGIEAIDLAANMLSGVSDD